MRIGVKTIKVVAVASAACMAIAGCDPLELITKRKEQERTLAAEPAGHVREDDAVPQKPAKSECAALLHHVETQVRIIRNEADACQAEVAALQTDRVKLSARIGALTDASLSDKNGTAVSALLSLLKDSEINVLAMKYLANDFAVIRSEFAGKARAAQQDERGRLDALSRNRAEFEKSVSDGRRKADQEYQRNVAAANRLRREIEAKEKKLKGLRASAPPGGRTYDQQRRIHQQNVQSLERDLSRMKMNLDRLENSLRASQANRVAEQERIAASRERRLADEKVAKANRDDVQMSTLVDEYRARTINRLDETLHARQQDAERRQKRATSKILYLESVTNGLEKLDSQALADVRTDIGRRLAQGENEGTKVKSDGDRR